jgi:UDP-N-acetylmuramoyl-tripeptide--D-alanyl-D-alanine ligase
LKPNLYNKSCFKGRLMQAKALFHLAELLEITHGTLHAKGDRALLETTRYTLSTDSREIEAGTCFIPLVGERFNGHEFLSQLPRLGVALACCERTYYEAHQLELDAMPDLSLLVVEDTLQALQALAQCHRRRCKATIIALTGSSGKTTLKDYLAHVCGHYYKTQATPANHNNDIGVAQTLLSIQAETQVVIIEMGMRGLGQIRRLSLMAEPDIGLLINVGPAHLEQLGSLENTAQAKCELVEGLKHRLISNGEDPYLEQRLAELDLKALSHERYGLTDASPLVSEADGGFRFTFQGVTFTTPLPGRHQVSNLLAVLKVATALNISPTQVAKALESFSPQAGRFARLDLGGGHQLINDAYNANPVSMQASLNALMNTPLPQSPPKISKRVLVLGSMKELGEESVAYHQALLDEIRQFPLEQIAGIVCIGEPFGDLAPLAGDFFYAYFEETAGFDHALQKEAFLEKHALNDSSLVLEWFLKGSRFHQLETLIPTLEACMTIETSPL